MSLEEERCEDTEENRDEEQMMVEAETGVMSPSTEGQDCWQPPETKRDKDPSLELWREMALQQLDLDF